MLQEPVVTDVGSPRRSISRVQRVVARPRFGLGPLGVNFLRKRTSDFREASGAAWGVSSVELMA